MKTLIQKCLASAGALALAGLCTVASATPISVFNTGVDASGNVLPNGTFSDLHYTMISAPGGQSTDIQVATSAAGFPIGPWVGDNNLSAWIGPNTFQLDGPVGFYDYRTTFDLTGLNAATASLTFQWSVDNGGADILINNVSTGLMNSGFSQFTNATISTNFIAGLNTLDFIVYNVGGPTGLRVQFDQQLSQADSNVPEPESLALMGLGLTGLVVARRRKV